MNPENYGSLEACQRLIKVGIVLETDFHWCLGPDGAWFLLKSDSYSLSAYTHCPAPSMAEVWRELRLYRVWMVNGGDLTEAWIEWSIDSYGKCGPSFKNANPIDTLINLLIWVRKEASKP